MRKKILAVVLSIVLLCSTLSGCGSRTTGNGTHQDVVETVTEAGGNWAEPGSAAIDSAKDEKDNSADVLAETPEVIPDNDVDAETSNVVTANEDSEKVGTKSEARLKESSSNPDAADIDENGNVEAKTEGETDITKSDGKTQNTEHVEVVPVKCDHVYGDGIVEKEADCVNSGYTLYVCEKCGVDYRTAIPALGHSMKENVVQSTCTEEGKKTETCTVCGWSKTDAIIPVLPHQYTVANTKEATCTEDGEAVEVCDVCGKEKKTVISAKGHTWSEWTVDMPSTTEKEGQRSRSCACGAVETEVIPKHVHVYEGIGTSPTCTTDGVITYTCECGDSYTDVTPATGHSGKWVATKTATCTEPGEESLMCSSCGEVLDVRSTAAKGHGITEWNVTKQPTCTETGTESRICKDCGGVVEDRVIAAEGHDYAAVTTDATCTESGKTVHTCTKCGDYYEDSLTPALGHTEGSWVETKAATCTEQGEESLICSACGKTLDTRNTAAQGHIPGEWVGTASATCGDAGTEELRCTKCNIVLDTREVSAIGHDYRAVTIDPTCTESGKTVYTCAKCGRSYEDGQTAALGHTAGDWVVDIQAACEAAGSRHKSCTVCNDVIETETIPATGHNWTTNTVAATCQTEGYTEQECTVCHVTDNKVSTGFAEHTAGEWTVDKPADCQNDGQKSLKCTVCGTVMETQVIASDGTHNMEIVGVVEAFPCQDGYTVYKCTQCGKTQIDDEIPGGGKDHDYDWDAKTLIGGRYYKVPCKVCGSSFQMDEDQIQQAKDEQAKTAQALAAIDTVISQIIKDGMTNAEKIYAVNTWLCNNVEYDYDTSDFVVNNPNQLIGGNSFNIYGAMIDGKAVCAGYAKAFSEFMEKLGIECLYVTSDSMNHAWNQVKLEDGWYWVDVTWNDTGKTEGFFGYDKYLFQTGKRVDDEVGGVECNGTMYKNGGAMYDKYNVTSQEDINKIYAAQSGEDLVYISMNSTDSSLWSTLSNEYKTKHGEAFTISLKNIGNKKVYCIKNTDEVRSFFEERMQAGETNEIMVLSLAEASEAVNSVSSGDAQPNDLAEAETSEASNESNPASVNHVVETVVGKEDDANYSVTDKSGDVPGQ